jgi:aldose 1-epimerase
MTVHKEPFGEVRGNGVDLYTLSNSDGFTVKITNYGGIITSILAKDKNEKFGDVVLGFDGVQGYLDNTGPYFGAIIGRYANRIAKGQFTLDGKQYTLPINNGPNSLHGMF